MHAYNDKGEPCHFVKTKKGAKNPTRPTQLKDVKKNKWFPSVTTITGTLSQDWLTSWKCFETAKAAFNERPRFKESEAGYAGRVSSSVLDGAGEAALIGDGFHKALEAHYKGETVPDTLTLYGGVKVPTMDVIGPAIALVGELGVINIQSEFVTVNRERGYAGTVDMKAFDPLSQFHFILDFKSKKTKQGKAIDVSELYAPQLAAYARSEGVFWDEQMHDSQRVAAYNLFISSTEVGRVELVPYTVKDLGRAWGAFKNMLALYEWRTGYSAAR